MTALLPYKDKTFLDNADACFGELQMNPQNLHNLTYNKVTQIVNVRLPIPAWPTIHDMRMKSITPQMFNMQRTCRENM